MAKRKRLLSEQESEIKRIMYDELAKVNSPKAARAWHRKYKKYGGLPLLDRYPKLPLILYLNSLIISLAAVIISVMLLLR